MIVVFVGILNDCVDGLTQRHGRVSARLECAHMWNISVKEALVGKENRKILGCAE